VFIATWLSYAGYYVCRKVFGVIKAPLREALHTTDISIANLWMVYLIAYMVGQFLSASLGRYISPRRLVLCGMATALLANLSIGGLLGHLGYAQLYPALMLALAIEGLAQATGWPGNLAILAHFTRRAERGVVFSLWCTCYQLGPAVAKGLAAYLYGVAGLRWAFWGSGAVLAVVLGIFYRYGHARPASLGLPDLVDPPPAVPVGSDGSPGRPRAPLSDRQLFRLFLAMGLVYFSFKFLRYSLDSWSALILRDRFHQSTTTAGYLSTVFDWVGFLGVLLGGFASDRIFGGRRSPVMFIMSSGACLAAGFLIYAGSSSLVSFVVVLGLLGFLLMGPDALLSGTAAVDAGSRRSAIVATGVINGLGSVGPIVQEPLIGWLFTHRGLDAVFLLLGLMTLLAMLGTGLLWRWSQQQKFPL
jgi:OPA family sugar phosphate sensor protein UhpC-like MFS transporter